VTLVTGIAIQGGEPVFDDPIDEIRREWIDEGQQYLAGDYVIGLGFVLFYIPFIVALRVLSGRAEGGAELWSRVAFIGAFTTMVWAILASAFWGTLAFGDFAKTATDETLQTLMVLDYYTNAGLPLAFVVFVGATSIVIAQTSLFWRWLAVLGAIEVILAILAPLSVLSDTSSSPLDAVYEIAFAGFLLWVVAVGIAMLSRRSELTAPAGA
jgi:hypothetical protein